MDKNNRKMNKLYKIKDALEALARRDVETMKEIENLTHKARSIIELRF